MFFLVPVINCSFSFDHDFLSLVVLPIKGCNFLNMLCSLFQLTGLQCLNSFSSAGPSSSVTIIKMCITSYIYACIYRPVLPITVEV